MIVSTQSYSDISPSWITTLLLQRGLWNLIKLWAMPCRTTQDGQVIVESSEKMWSTGGGNGNPLQYSCHENPMNSMKRQKYKTLEDKPSRLECVQYATIEVVVVQSLSHVQLFATLWTAAHQASLSFIFSQSMLKLISIEFVIPSNHFIPLPPSPPAFNLSQLSESFRVFFNKSPLHIRWLKYWSFNFSIHH